MNRLNRGELLAGLAVAGFGAFLSIKALDLNLGSMRRPGPGAVPLGVGLIVGVLGLVAALQGARQAAGALQPIRLRPLAAVALALIGFALLAETAGFVPAALFVVLVSGAGEMRDNWLALTLAGLALGMAGSALFIRLLGVPLPVLPPALGIF
ncbi:MAG: tripartite tricarboxylate transporter TctB family protein [Pararhodobacter sp.]|nr:tripartite tricarboxylate transporter TctB family protein [Pararhodobacter sp.]